MPTPTLLRRLADAAVTPLDLDDVLDVFSPLRGGAELRAGSSRSRPRPPSPRRSWSSRVATGPGTSPASTSASASTSTASASGAPTRSPTARRADRCISITVKAIPGGVVSNYLVHRARVGEMIQLEQAEGEFVLPQPLPGKLLLVTAGSGITPVIGMLRNLFSRRTPGRRPTSCWCTST